MSKTPLEKFDENRKNSKFCLECLHHVTRTGKNAEAHFCGKNGKLLLYPLYLPKNCKNWEHFLDFDFD